MKTNINMKWISGLVLSTLVMTACKPTSEEQQAIDTALGQDGQEVVSDNEDADCSEAAESSECFVEEFRQPTAKKYNQLDILFVTDTSGSLNEERPAIARELKEFVAQLPADINYNVALMLGHGSRGAHSSKLYKYKNDPYVLKSDELSIDEISEQLVYKMTHTKTDNFSDGGEEGLYSLQHAFDNGMKTAIGAHGFLRPEAALAVIFIADENDICAEYPAGVKPVADPDKVEPVAKTRDCEGISPARLYQTLLVHQNGRPLLVSGIIYNESSVIPKGGENEIGYGYLELIRMSGGVAVDLSGNRYHEGLAEIGSLVKDRLELVREHQIKNADIAKIDPSTVKAFVDGREVEISYNEENGLVRLIDDAGRDNSLVEIHYCLKSVEPEVEPVVDPVVDPVVEPTPEPNPTPTPEPTPAPEPDPGMSTQPWLPPGVVDRDFDGIDDVTGEPYM